MEQITLTKEELKEIIAKEVRNAIKGENQSVQVQFSVK